MNISQVRKSVVLLLLALSACGPSEADLLSPATPTIRLPRYMYKLDPNANQHRYVFRDDNDDYDDRPFGITTQSFYVVDNESR